jgi:hypothetical protein
VAESQGIGNQRVWLETARLSGRGSWSPPLQIANAKAIAYPA